MDPGIRKFMVGYDPKGTSVFIGENNNGELIKLSHEVDKCSGNEKLLKWKRIKDMVNELHWKTISYLVKNYDIIVLPDFRVSEMIRSRKLSKITKRLMNMYSFHSFKEKLKYKCDLYEKRLIFVSEEYTSCTCGKCGIINRLKGQEVFKCHKCGTKMDRDVNGSRNILIKNWSTLRPSK